MTKYNRIEKILFPGKNPDLKEVEKYIKNNIESYYINREYNDVIRIGSKFASEYCGSIYTKRLRGALLKAKANAVQIIPDLILNATNRRWLENKNEKHKNNASGGWYRYEVRFSLPILDDVGDKVGENYYYATLIVRINEEGLFLHDLINIKKEASKPFES